MKLRILFIFLAISLSGCSLIYSYSDDLPHRIDQWIAEKKYNIALDTISHIQLTHKDYRVIQRKKKIILKKIISYENMAIKKSTKLANQGNWILALKLLDEVESNIVNTKRIKKHRAKLLKKRNKLITTYEDDVLNSQAKDLLNKMELYKKIKKTVSTNESNQLDISRFDDLRQETSLRLAKRSEQEYQRDQYNKAFSSIELDLKLKPDESIVSRLKTIKQRLKKKTRRKKLSYVKDAKELLTKLSQGYSHAILNKTKITIVWLNKNKNDEQSYRVLINKLEKHLAAGIKQRFEAARNLYSKGKTQEALSIWLELKELDPDNAKLQSHIERAEKVLIKLKKLTNKPAKKK